MTSPELTMELKLLSLATCQVRGTAALLSGTLACVHKITRSDNGSLLATPNVNWAGLAAGAIESLSPQATTELAAAAASAAFNKNSRRLVVSVIARTPVIGIQITEDVCDNLMKQVAPSQSPRGKKPSGARTCCTARSCLYSNCWLFQVLLCFRVKTFLGGQACHTGFTQVADSVGAACRRCHMLCTPYDQRKYIRHRSGHVGIH
jgi:hypothetical protein